MSESVFQPESLLGRFVPRITDYRLKDGRTVWIRNLSALEQGEHEYEQLDPVTLQHSKAGLLMTNARLICRCLVDGPEGDRIFTLENAATIAEQDNAIVAELATLCEKHCGRRLSVSKEAKN